MPKSLKIDVYFFLTLLFVTRVDIFVWKKINALSAAEEISEIEKKRVREEAKAEVASVKKELRTLNKRMDQQCTREVRGRQNSDRKPGVNKSATSAVAETSVAGTS